MRAFISISAVLICFAVSGGASAQAVFNFDASLGGWTSSGVDSGVDNFRLQDQAMQFDYVSTAPDPFDPILQSPTGLGLDASDNHWLRIDVEVTTPGAAGPQTFQVFFDDGDADGNAAFNEPDSRTFTVAPNSGVVTVVFDMTPVPGGRDAFSGTINRFRIDPGNNEAELVGGSAVVELIALTSDTDFDNIPDDAEIAIFGDTATADATSDFDGDGITDAQEIALGLDPLVDEGVTLPVRGAGVLAGAFVLASLLYLRGRRKGQFA